MRLSFLTLFALLATAWSQMREYHRELQACAQCRVNSPGTQCQAAPGGVCWNLNPRTGQCPAGTFPCPGVVETGPACRNLGKDVIDQGCNEALPVCVYANGGEVVGTNAGHHCALCINSLQPNDADQVAPDEGCDIVDRVCVGPTARQLAATMEGTACAPCVNSIPTDIDPTDIDDGCSPKAPVCVNDAGDSPALYTPGTACVANCFDSSLTDADDGVSCCVVFARCTS